MANMNYAPFLHKGPGKPEKGSISDFATRYDAARRNFFLVLIMTTINLVLLLIGSDRYMLFSATIPYYLPAFAKAIFIDGIVVTFCFGVSITTLILYAVSWLLSKQRSGWMIFALVLFLLDTLTLVVLVLATQTLSDMLLDILFHAWILYYLFSGVSNASKFNRAFAALPETPDDDYLVTGPEITE